MTGRLLATIAAGIVVMLIGCAGALGAFVTGDLDTTATTGDDTTAACGTSSNSSTAVNASPAAGIGRWDAGQVANAAAIVDTGIRLGVPPRGWVIAVATAMQESSLHNYPNLGARNDHDSLGLFQQRPSQGWGTPAQILDPTHAATSFYRHLLTVPGWQTMPLTRAAQAVQRSAFPDAYAKWERPATTLVAALTDTDTGISADFDCASPSP
jgi:hypothetical protein